ncbi:ABC transporter permease [Listeria monocytogenes]|nr:ABC transporter permease [Listeria monocytogenes]
MRDIFTISKLRFKLLNMNFLDTVSIQVRAIVTILPYLLFIDFFKTSNDINIIFIVVSFLITLYLGNNIIMISMYMLDEKKIGRSNYYKIMDISTIKVMLGNIIPWMIVSLVGIIFTYVIVSLLLGFTYTEVNIPLAIMAFIVVSIQSILLGNIICYFVLKKNNIRIVFYVFSLLLFFSGYLYPITVLPIYFRFIAFLNPLYYGLDLIRYYLSINPVTQINVEIEWIIFIISMIVLISLNCVLILSKRFEKNFI